MDRIVFWATDALSASLLVGIAGALVWGVCSVLLSPCHLGTIPLVVGMVGATGGERDGRPRPGSGALLAFSFAGGMLIAIAALGVAVATAGFALQTFRTAIQFVIAALFVAAGLNLVGILPLSLPSLRVNRGRFKGVAAAVFVGLVFGVGLSPCTFAFLAPTLGVTFGSAATNPLRGVLLLLAFAVGHCAVIGIAGSSTEIVQRYLDWNATSKALTVLKRACGVLVLISAGVLIYNA